MSDDSLSLTASEALEASVIEYDPPLLVSDYAQMFDVVKFIKCTTGFDVPMNLGLKQFSLLNVFCGEVVSLTPLWINTKVPDATYSIVLFVTTLMISKCGIIGGKETGQWNLCETSQYVQAYFQNDVKVAAEISPYINLILEAMAQPEDLSTLCVCQSIHNKVSHAQTVNALLMGVWCNKSSSEMVAQPHLVYMILGLWAMRGVDCHALLLFMARRVGHIVVFEELSSNIYVASNMLLSRAWSYASESGFVDHPLVKAVLVEVIDSLRIHTHNETAFQEMRNLFSPPPPPVITACDDEESDDSPPEPAVPMFATPGDRIEGMNGV